MPATLRQSFGERFGSFAARADSKASTRFARDSRVSSLIATSLDYCLQQRHFITLGGPLASLHGAGRSLPSASVVALRRCKNGYTPGGCVCLTRGRRLR